jgi:hypothetical protein
VRGCPGKRERGKSGGSGERKAKEGEGRRVGGRKKGGNID